MIPEWRYRVEGVLGTVILTALAVTIANHPLTQTGFDLVPVLNQLPGESQTNGDLALIVLTTAAVTLGAFWPLFKPRPRRILEIMSMAAKRVVLATIALAAIGYFDWTYRLPRSTLIVASVLMLVLLPAWFVNIRRRPRTSSQAILVGDDEEVMQDVFASADVPVIGYISPPNVSLDGREQVAVSDGGGPERGELDRLGGLARLDDVLVDSDVDTALLAFSQSDRSEFFGALASCYKHDVVAKVHRDHADSVLISDIAGGNLVSVDLEPWDWQDHLMKRAFDIAFAATGLLVLSPVMLVIAIAVKLDSPGPVLYSHERTAGFGETFRVYKFRSMIPEAEAETGAQLSDEDAGEEDPRVTRVGRFLRRTHLDEIPQLWSILKGDMSVVGPRPERPELDEDIGRAIDDWQRRWFVRPGLTGLAQIRGATGHEPEEKLRFDVEYIRRQSFWFDLKIVVRQIWLVLVDVCAFLSESDEDDQYTG